MRARYADPETTIRRCTRCGERFRTDVNDPFSTCSADCEAPSRPVYLPADNIRTLIKATAGLDFAVEFIKKDGSRRLLYGRTGTYSDIPRTDVVTVWDTEAGDFRSIPLDRVLSFAIATESKVMPAPQFPSAYQTGPVIRYKRPDKRVAADI